MKLTGNRSDCLKLERVASLLASDRHPQHEMGRGGTAHLGFFLAPAPWATPLCYALQNGSQQWPRPIYKQKGTCVKVYWNCGSG